MNQSLQNLPDDVLINEILPTISLSELSALCRGDARIRSLCNNERLWLNRIRREYPEEVKNMASGQTGKEYYRYLRRTVSIPVLVEDDYEGNVRVDPKNLMPTINELMKKLNVRPDEILSFIFLKGTIPLAVYNHPIGDLVINERRIGTMPDRLYVREEELSLGQASLPSNIYPWIYSIGRTLWIGDDLKFCEKFTRYEILDHLKQLKVPIEENVPTDDILSQFPERHRAMLSKEPIEKLQYYARWKRYTIAQICQILYDYLEKTGRVF